MNALFTGVGAAVGVTLPVEATVEIEFLREGTPRVEVPPESDSPLVRSALLESLRMFGGPREVSARVEVRSGIPTARGLKSSSAVATAVIGAAVHALHRPCSPEVVAHLAADVAQSIGSSATGAYDDALAGLRPGVQVTDNASRRVVRSFPVEEDWRVVLWIPRATHLPSTRWVDEFRTLGPEGRAAVDLALRGDFPGAMARNTELVERALGLEYRGLREEARRQGATASGVSGMGPTLAIVVPSRRVSDVTRVLPRGQAEVRVVMFTQDESDGGARGP